MRKIRNQSGYNVVEIILVMAIILIILGGFFTGYVPFIARNRVKTAIRQIVLLKKAINNIADVCQEFPARALTDRTDLNSIRPIISANSCQSPGAAETSFPKYPSGLLCEGASLDHELREDMCISAPTPATAKNSELGFSKAFTSITIDDCSPQYGGIAGTGYPGVNYQPGWNYVLLTDTSAIEKPVAVICGFALGHRKLVKIVINTSGFYGGNSIPEGAGCKDITGATLASACPCGPWCSEYTLGGVSTGHQGCCSTCNASLADVSECGGGAGGVRQGIGYQF
ncbi:MAG: type II secretion system protein [bacterium]